MLFALNPTLVSVLRSVSGPATLGVVLSAALVIRLILGEREHARGWAVGMAWVGFAVYLAWQIAVLFVLPTGNMDLSVFHRAGHEAALGRDPYLFRGEMVFLSPPPALGAFRLISAVPFSVLGIVWGVASALMTVALVPLSNRLLARDRVDDPVAPPALPGDVVWLLGAALVNSNASIWGHRSGQLCAWTAFLLILALRSRQLGRLVAAGVCLAGAAFKPATVLPFLVFFLRKRDWRTWLSLVVVSLGLSFAAGPPGTWGTLVRHNLRQIGASGEPGNINDYDYPRAISSDILAFNHLYHRVGLRDRGLISGLQGVSVAVLLAGLFLIRDRRPFGAVAALSAIGSMLVLYHRMYDAVILALPLVYASAIALSASGRRRALAVACVALLLGVFDQPREALIALTGWSLDQGVLGRVVQVVVLPYAEWSLLLAMLCLALCAIPRRGDAPALGAGLSIGPERDGLENG